jgi:hypothetical protein
MYPRLRGTSEYKLPVLPPFHLPVLRPSLPQAPVRASHTSLLDQGDAGSRLEKVLENELQSASPVPSVPLSENGHHGGKMKHVPQVQQCLEPGGGPEQLEQVQSAQE